MSFQQYANTATPAHTPFAAAANYSAYAPNTQMQQSFGPNKLLHLDATRQYLGNASLTESYLLDLSRQAILYGYLEQQYGDDGVLYNRIAWNNLMFVLSRSFDAVLYISYDSCKVVPVQPQPQPQAQHNTFQHAEDSEEYELMINEIVDSVDKDMQADNAFAFYSASNEIKTQTPPPCAPAAAPEQITVHTQPLLQTQASNSPSKSPSLSPSPPPECSFGDTSYHTIYLKPIMERLAKCEPAAQVTGNYVAEIVSSALRLGVKRQISKRTFSFAWRQYTVVMSKSLRTILDVAVAREAEGEVAAEVVTVHPDVVSILAKKWPALDYFAIQRVAERAKRGGQFATKKNDYRQQFIYDFAGFHIVFASNHSTIVEMQATPDAAAATAALL